MIQFYSMPKWTQYIAQDHEGKWFAFNKEPKQDNNCNWVIYGKHLQIYPIIFSTLQKLKR